MTFSVFTNFLVMMLCIAVLVQSVRMMRSLKAVKDGGLRDTVAALDNATREARAVLSELKKTLQTDCASNARTVIDGGKILEELTMMIGIGNSVAERILEASGKASKAPAKPASRAAAKKAA
ncbi:MAG: hypothetical protein JWO25_2864 [Alphaproteobacteria bacterium]|nr:hypothetical protein [Alphaproteobacteria bacterium]MDB5722194.1 hypothetical protein [Alphaproteobacteria bacterium]